VCLLSGREFELRDLIKQFPEVCNLRRRASPAQASRAARDRESGCSMTEQEPHQQREACFLGNLSIIALNEG